MSDWETATAEAIDLLLQTGRDKIRAVEIRRNECEPTGEYIIVDKDGAHQRVLPAVPPRRYQAFTLASFCALVNEFAGRLGNVAERPEAGAPPIGAPQVFVFVGRTSVVALLDEGVRRERVRFGLEAADSFEALSQLQTAGSVDQKGMIDLLRRRLNCPMEPAGLVGTVRTLKFTANASGSASVQQGRESLGKQIEKELVGAEALPDTVRLTLPVFGNVRQKNGELYTVAVDCALDVNIDDQRFTLRPKAGEMARVMDGVLEFVRGQVAEACKLRGNVQVFVGNPDDR